MGEKFYNFSIRREHFWCHKPSHTIPTSSNQTAFESCLISCCIWMDRLLRNFCCNSVNFSFHVFSRGRSSRYHFQSSVRSSKWNFLWGTSFPHSLVPIPDHLRHPLKTKKNFIANRFQGSSDGQHFIACPVSPKCKQSSKHVPSAGIGLRWESVAIDL